VVVQRVAKMQKVQDAGEGAGRGDECTGSARRGCNDSGRGDSGGSREANDAAAAAASSAAAAAAASKQAAQ